MWWHTRRNQRRNGRVHLNRRGRQFSRLLTGELCTSACRVCTARVSLCSAVTWRLLITHSILLFLLHFSSRASPCAITFQMQSTTNRHVIAQKSVILFYFAAEAWNRAWLLDVVCTTVYLQSMYLVWLQKKSNWLSHWLIGVVPSLLKIKNLTLGPDIGKPDYFMLLFIRIFSYLW
jgi:hypothetical protein